MDKEKIKKEEEIENKDVDLELFKKLVPYLFEEEINFLKWLPLVSVILEFLTFIVIIIKIK
jgi:hypothetical protein